MVPSDAKEDIRNVGALVKALGDEDCYVRQEAASALGGLNDRRAVEPLIEVLGGDDDEDVREEAAWALGKIGDTRAIDPLIRALFDGDKDVREEVAWALGKIRAVKAVEILGQVLMTDPEEDVREQSACALGRIRNARAIELLNQAVNDKSVHVRRVAKEALDVIRTNGKEVRE